MQELGGIQSSLTTEQEERNHKRQSGRDWQELRENICQYDTNLSGTLASHGSPRRSATCFDSPLFSFLSAPIGYEALS